MKHRTASMVPLPPDDIENPECIGTFMSVTWDEKMEKAPPANIMKQVREVCESEAMKEFCARAGVHGVSFEWNENNSGAGRLFRRESNISTQFWKSYETSVKKALHLPHHKEQFIRFFDAYKHDDSLKRMAIVFHGTPEERIPEILNNGLDPRYRKTQAFGKGRNKFKSFASPVSLSVPWYLTMTSFIFQPQESTSPKNQVWQQLTVKVDTNLLSTWSFFPMKTRNTTVKKIVTLWSSTTCRTNFPLVSSRLRVGIEK